MALAHMFPHVNFSIVENFRCFPAISYVNRLGSSNYVTAGRSQITFLHVYPQGLHDVCSKVSHKCQMVGACLNKHTNCWVSVMTGTRNWLHPSPILFSNISHNLTCWMFYSVFQILFCLLFLLEHKCHRDIKIYFLHWFIHSRIVTGLFKILNSYFFCHNWLLEFKYCLAHLYKMH